MKFRLVLAALLAAAALRAAPLERDLGQGLAYVRVHAVPADLPAPEAKSGPTVIDLRYVAAPPADSLAALQAWLRFHASPATPVFVLFNAQTGANIRAALARLSRAPGFLSIGPDLPDHPADSTIDTTPETERQAYDALELGAAPETLIAENAGKPRQDEAALAQNHDAAAEVTGDEAGDADPEAAKPAAPPVDSALQRAVHLHRALVALHRLPARG